MGKIKKQYSCALVLVQSLIGGKWKLRILWHIHRGNNRFSLLKKKMPDISEKVLAEQLQELLDSDMLTREIISVRPLNIKYALSEKWPQLPQLVEELCQFARLYAADNDIDIED